MQMFLYEQDVIEWQCKLHYYVDVQLNPSTGNKLIEVVDIFEVFWTNLGGKSWCATIYMWF